MESSIPEAEGRDSDERSDRTPRVYKREWSAPAWRGTLEELIDAGEAVLVEIRKATDDASKPHQYVNISYSDGSNQTFDSIEQLSSHADEIDDENADSAHLSLGMTHPAATIYGSREFGISIVASGSETFANGVVATMRSRMAGGVAAGKKARRDPFGMYSILTNGLPTVAIGGLGIVAAFNGVPLLAILVSGLSLIVLLSMSIEALLSLGNSVGRPASFALVADGHQFGPKARAGPIWHAKAWLERHPAISVCSLLIAGALLDRTADQIQF